MTDHIYDTSRIAPSIVLENPSAYSNRGEFRFWIDDKRPHKTMRVDLGEIDDDLDRIHVVGKEYQVQPVPKDKSHYTLHYSFFAKLGGSNELEPVRVHDLEVWPAQGTLIVRNSDNNSYVNNFKFKIIQDAVGGNERRNDDSPPGQNGKYTFDLHPGTPYQIRPVPPWTIKEDPPDPEASQRKLKVREEIEAEFIKPLGVKESGGRLNIYDQDAHDNAVNNSILKQYVNLSSSEYGQDAKGHEVTIEVGAKGDKNRELDAKHGGTGRFVYFKVTFSAETGDKSKRSHPKTEPIPGGQLTSRNLKRVRTGKEYKGKVELNSPNKTGEFKVELGYAGGDKCEIKIWGTKECPEDTPDATLTFINWRKLYYELIYPDTMTNLIDTSVDTFIGTTRVGSRTFKDIPSLIKTYLAQRLGEVYIEYDLAESQPFAQSDVLADKRYCFSSSEFLGSGSFYLDMHLLDYFLGTIGDPKFPKKFQYPQPATRMRVLLAHSAFACKRATATNPSIAKGIEKVMTDNPFTIDAPNKNYFLPNNPRTGRNTLNVNGFQWKFMYDKNGSWTDEDYPLSPVSNFVEWAGTVDNALGTAKDKIFRIENTNGGQRHEVHFKGLFSATQRVKSSEKRKLKQWVLDEFNSLADKKKFALPANKARIRITGDISDTTRVDALKAAIEQSFADNLRVCNERGRDGHGKCMKGDLDADWFEFETSEKLKVTLPGDNPEEPGILIEYGAIGIRFEIDVSFGINGCAGQDHQILTIPDLAPVYEIAEPEKFGSKASTICHELGHRMGMTIMEGRSKVSKGTPAAKHVDNKGDYYINAPKGPYKNGKRSIHQGPHCAHGISTANKKKHDFGQAAGDCIMYGQGSPNADSRTAFCDTCKEYIKARKLTSIICNWRTLSEEDS